MLVVRSRQRGTKLHCPIDRGGNGSGIRVAIPLAPLMMIVNQRNSVEVHLGYNVDGSNDAGNMLLFSVVTFP